MKKLSFLIAVILTFMMAIVPVHADSVDDLLKNYGLSESEVEAFHGLIVGVNGDMTMTEEQIVELLQSMLGDVSSPRPEGTLEDGLYTNPMGFALIVPEGWDVTEDQPGVDVALIGPVGDFDFSPTITVLVLDQEQSDFETMTQEDWDSVLEPVLANYQSLVLDDFEYLGAPAHEFVCIHGTSDDAMIMQYQMYFNMNNRAYMITMTTLAEEAAHENALYAYDTLLSEFQVLEADGGVG